MRVLSFLAALMVAAVLSACGGGGGSSGSNPQQPTVQTTAPSALRMPLGVVQQYRVYGGVAPYQVTSSDSRIVTASINGEVLLINSVGQGTANVQIRDRNTGAVTVAVTVGDPLALSLSSVTSYVGDTVKVLITGGTPPYRVSVLDIALDATINGNELSLLLKAVGGPFDVTVIDALNQTAKMTVEKIIPGSPQFNLVPASVSVPEKSETPLTFRIAGGVAPYTVRSLNPALFTATVAGEIVTVNTGSLGARCVLADTPVEIQVNDSRGGFATATITVVDDPNVCAKLTVSPTTVSSYVGDSVQVQVQGGLPPYRLGGLDPLLSVDIQGATINLKLLGVGGPFQVSVFDQLGQTANLNVTALAGSPQFNLAPAALRVSEVSNETLRLLIAGGTGPYTVRSSDPTLLQVSLSGTTVSLATGTKGNRCVAGDQDVIIEVQDSRGAYATSTVTVVDNPAGCGSLKVAPSAVRVRTGEDAAVRVSLSGQSSDANVSLTVSRPDRVKVTYASGVITIEGKDPGNAQVYILDAGQPGVSATIDVTVE